MLYGLHTAFKQTTIFYTHYTKAQNATSRISRVRCALLGQEERAGVVSQPQAIVALPPTTSVQLPSVSYTASAALACAESSSSLNFLFK